MLRVRGVTTTAGVLALVGLLTLGDACARQPKPSGAEPAAAPAAASNEVAIQVRNECSCSVTVYLLQGGQRSRIGTVRGLSTETFSLPRQSTGDVQLLADAIGSLEAARTERLVVRAGQYIVWTLAADLSRSSVAVYE